MKVILLLIAVFCIVSIGLMINNYYKDRRNFYVNLCNFCDTLKVNISYSQNKINEIIFDFKKTCDKPFGDFLTKFQMTLNNKSTAVDLNNTLKILNDKERQDVLKFFNCLGSLGVDEEIEKIVLNRDTFCKIKDRCEEQKSKLSPLYIKLFIVLALGVLIIFL